MPAGEVAEITDTIECHIVGDRMRFTLVSGKRKEDFSISFNKARSTCRAVMRLLDEREREQTDRVRAFKGVEVAEPRHG